ncbi:hypothetical protein SAMN06295974_1356 [Plantibacter flavus]|uniref:Uncharacterized protein n=1 Tax=Plantibacter flavus TaxID=150123 RepID=A0A3N2C701_9MICO|nr:hypothetical protein [Plantibacter flavus]ROR83288.1 hypothetical protein EDD42_3399 [Plantibacter flavus]SMG22321.1 hypothetical protein SAMN06295974_1356 [Plantibacter flavus]
MEPTADTFDRWAGRISRFNTSRIELLTALGGAVGLGFSILDGTVLQRLAELRRLSFPTAPGTQRNAAPTPPTTAPGGRAPEQNLDNGRNR